MTRSEQAVNHYDEVEGQLQESFRPVIPDPEFVRRLYRRLTTTPAMVVERRSDAAMLLVIAFGVLMGAVLLMTIKRIVNRLLKQG